MRGSTRVGDESGIRVLAERIVAAAAGAGREASEVGVVAVTKTRAPGEIMAAVAAAEQAGVRIVALGENRVQEALRKQPDLSELALPWHFIGRLQTNKVKDAAGHFALVHSFDRADLIVPFQKWALGVPVLIEVNVAGEATKAGVTPGAAAQLLDDCQAAGLEVRGLMTMAPQDCASAAVRVFADLYELRERLRGSSGLPLVELSMGMTDDFESAIAAGATLIRIGRALFGERSLT